MHPTRQSSEDLVWMRRALDLARKMRGHVWPNPPVGCVIVKDGTLVAGAATQPGGRPHAERKALDAAGTAARGATLYVTLEPCCHWGRTPPCADAIIEAGLSRVVASIRDPDPRVNGGGFARLREAGIAVSVGACADEAENLMSGFFNRIRLGVPEVIVSTGPSDELPSGTDALITSSERGVQLLARHAQLNVSDTDPNRLLARLGELGLTSVAVPQDDPLTVIFADARTKAAVDAVPQSNLQTPTRL